MSFLTFLRGRESISEISASRGKLREDRDRLLEENYSLKRVQGNALRVAFNSGRQLGDFLQVSDDFLQVSDDFLIDPELSPDGMSVSVAFPTLTAVLFPYAEKMQVVIVGSTERREFSMRDGKLRSDDLDVVLGMLERSRRIDKTLPSTLALTGVVIERITDVLPTGNGQEM